MTNRTKRLAAFQQRAYGLFLHYGLYSLSSSGEWTLHHHKLDLETYRRRMGDFTAEGFDSPGLARWARQCGFRYACLTTRHHDGFSLYDTRGLNQYDAPHSAAGRDLVAEFAQAFRAEDLGVFFYHTTLDWSDPRFDNDWPAYQQYLRDSVRILCTHYGPVDGFWFDGNWSRRDRDWEEDALYGMIRELQPDAVIVNNSSIGRPGERGHPELDVVTFEQDQPSEALKDIGMEMCQTLSSHWGCAANDFSQPAPARIIQDLLRCRAVGANLLLNTGPLPDGSLDPLDKALLEKTAGWIHNCLGDHLYSAQPVPHLAPSTGDTLLQTNDGHYLYFANHLPINQNQHLFHGNPNWDQRAISGPLPPIREITWLDNQQSLPFTQNTQSGLLAFQPSPCPYGSQFIARPARLLT